MANYSLVLNTKFDPFTFEEMFKPALMATQAQAQAEEQYQNLMEQAMIWGNRANEQTDPVAYNRYKNYADQLASYAEKLSRYGLSSADRQGIMEMRKRYISEINPIHEAYAKREKDRAAQQEIMLKDPTHIFGKYASTMSLDDYLNNPNIDVMTDHYSGAIIQQQVAEMAKKLSEEAREATVSKAKDARLYLQFTKKYGYSPEEVLKVMSNPRDPKANSVLKGILGSVMDSSGVANWASKEDFDRLLQYGAQGLFQAVGKTDIDYKEDVYAVKQLESELAMNNWRRQQKELAEQTQTDPDAQSGWTYMDLLTPKEQTKNDKWLADFNKFVAAGYLKINPDGTVVETKKGKQEFLAGIPRRSNGGYSGIVSPIGGSEYYRFMTDLLPAESLTNKTGTVVVGNYSANFKKNQPYITYDGIKEHHYPNYLISSQGASKLLTQKRNKLLAQNTGQGDAYKMQAIYSPISDEASQKSILAQLKTFNRSNLIPTYEWGGPDKGYIQTGERPDIRGRKAVGFITPPTGGTFVSLVDDNTNDKYKERKPIIVRVPTDLAGAYGATATSYVHSNSELQLVLNKNRYPQMVTNSDGSKMYKRDAKGQILFTNTPLTEEDRIAINEQIRKQSNAASGVQRGLQNNNIFPMGESERKTIINLQ